MVSLFYHIGQKIRQFLDENNINQTELAEKIGVSKQVMSKIILGKKAINVEEISKLACSMGVSLDYLMNYEEPQLATSSFLVMMGSIGKSNTKDDLSFLDHVMDEMIELEDLLRS